MTHPLNKMALDVCAYLKSEKVVIKTLSATPGILTIGKQEWAAAVYVSDVGNNHITRRMYVVGELPNSYKRSNHNCFQWQDVTGDKDWFVADYMAQYTVLQSDLKQYHPFGNWFSLHMWDVPDGGKIDQYENLYKRHDLKFRWMTGYYDMATPDGKMIVYEGASAFYICKSDQSQEERCMGDGVDMYGDDEHGTFGVGSQAFYDALTRDIDTNASQMHEAYFE